MGGDVAVYGVGWETFLAPNQIRADHLPNVELPAAYAAAGVVLNDHWPQMAADGFLSNRLFDAVATGARVVSDRARGLESVFGTSVRTYEGTEELRSLLTGERDGVFGDHEERLAAAAHVAQLHSFDERAKVLIERAQVVRAAR